MDNWMVRTAIVAGLTYAAVRFLPVGVVGKTVAIAVGGVAAAGIVAANVPLLGSVLNGRLPLLSSTSA